MREYSVCQLNICQTVLPLPPHTHMHTGRAALHTLCVCHPHLPHEHVECVLPHAPYLQMYTHFPNNTHTTAHLPHEHVQCVLKHHGVKSSAHHALLAGIKRVQEPAHRVRVRELCGGDRGG